jgi:hypothetical protein
MAETLHEERNIPLSEMIQSLRIELKDAMHRARGDDLKLKVKEIDVELRVAVGKGSEAGAGIKFWVVNATAGRKATELTTHVFRLKLEPELAGDGEAGSKAGAGGPVHVSEETSRRPR